MSIIKKQLYIVLLWYRLTRKHFDRIFHELDSLFFIVKNLRPKDVPCYAELKNG